MLQCRMHLHILLCGIDPALLTLNHGAVKMCAGGGYVCESAVMENLFILSQHNWERS